MENQLSSHTSEFEPAIATTEPPMNVAGTYQLFKFQEVEGQKKLLPSTTVVTITQRPDFIGVDLHNEVENTTAQLNYPMKNVSCWSEERNAFIFCRPISNGFIADIISPVDENRNLKTTQRNTWQVDAQGKIHEIFEHFDAAGNRLDSSQGYKRVLIPIAKI